MQVAYWGNYFSSLDCQSEKEGCWGRQCKVSDPSFCLALTHSLAALLGWTGTLCIFQSGLKCVILSPFCLNSLLWDQLPEGSDTSMLPFACPVFSAVVIYFMSTLWYKVNTMSIVLKKF